MTKISTGKTIERSESVRLVSLSWDEAVIAYHVSEMARITVECLVPGKKVVAESVEMVDVGRIRVTGLKSSTEHVVKVKWKRKNRRLTFKTLPKPLGDPLSSFAVLADPHLSEKEENRKGRLFVESASILSDVIREINDLNVDFTLIAGDLTNAGTVGEYKRWEMISRRFRNPCIAVPGDHDAGTAERVALWEKHIGPTQWIKDVKGYRIAGINTANAEINQEGYALIEKALRSRTRFPILLSHLQFIDNPAINIGTKQKTIARSDKTIAMLNDLRGTRAILYVGHQNIPVKVDIGDSVQINVPQPSQYVCGYYLVRRYSNGFYHTLMPINSEILREYSRIASNSATDLYGEKQWAEAYREGRGLEEANFVVD